MLYDALRVRHAYIYFKTRQQQQIAASGINIVLSNRWEAVPAPEPLESQYAAQRRRTSVKGSFMLL